MFVAGARLLYDSGRNHTEIQTRYTRHAYGLWLTVPPLDAGEKTNRLIGVSESLVAAFGCGVLFALFSGQPLLILGASGPVLVFEESLYKVRPTDSCRVCKKLSCLEQERFVVTVRQKAHFFASCRPCETQGDGGRGDDPLGAVINNVVHPESFSPLVLIAESCLFAQFCSNADLDYLPFRCWTCIWMAVVGVIVVAMEGQFGRFQSPSLP